jgi:hypothetical protein
MAPEILDYITMTQNIIIYLITSINSEILYK